ncbi:MAG: hypothetical protein RQM92_11025 [Candidatus Syntrophopropionicum ammoniitolerans]
MASPLERQKVLLPARVRVTDLVQKSVGHVDYVFAVKKRGWSTSPEGFVYNIPRFD